MITILFKYQFNKPLKIIKTTLYSIYRKHPEDRQMM